MQEALALLPAAAPFPMSFHGTLAFPRGRAALAPAVTADMALRQWRIVTALEATGAELHLNYVAGRWVPHVSAATRAQGVQLTTVVRAIADVLPLTVRVDRAAFVDSATGQTWPLATSLAGRLATPSPRGMIPPPHERYSCATSPRVGAAETGSQLT